MEVTIFASKKSSLTTMALGTIILLIILTFITFDKDILAQLSSIIILSFLSVPAIGCVWFGFKEFKNPSKLFSFNKDYILVYGNMHEHPIPWEQVEKFFDQVIGSTDYVGIDLKISYKKQFPKLLKKTRRLNKLYYPNLFVSSGKIKTRKMCKILNKIRRSNVSQRDQIIFNHFNNRLSNEIILT